MKIGAILSYFSIALNIVAGLLYTPWMIDMIGDSQYGLYTLANSLIALFLVDFGLSAATTRYLSKYNAEGDREAAERFLGIVYKLYIVIDALIFVALAVFFFFIDAVYVNLTPVELAQFKVVYLIAGLFSVINFPFITFNGILTAYEKFIPLKLADVLYRIFNIGFTVVALLLGYGLYALVTVHAAVGLLVLLFKYIVIRRTVPVRVNFKYFDRGILCDVFAFSIWVTVASLAQRLIFNVTPSILGIVTGSVAIAVFGIVTTIEGYVYTVTNAISSMFMPRVSQIMAREESQKNLHPLFLNMGKFQFALTGLIVTGFAVLGQSFISLWMGTGYEDAYYGILLVILPSVFYNAMQIGETALVVEKKVKLQALITVFVGVLNIALSFPLSMAFGVIGACASICIAYLLRVLLLLFIYHRHLPLHIPHFLGACYLRMLIPVALTVGAGFGINHLIPDSGWTVFLIKVLLISLVYLLLMLFLGISKADRAYVFSFLKRKRDA